MHLDKYEYKAGESFQDFSFYSEGPKGKIKKTVVYKKIQDSPIIYNLAFGDENSIDGSIDDSVVSNNDDRDVILATVANTINTFCDYYGNHFIFVTGSTPSRTRLYQISISRLINIISIDFDIWGIIDEQIQTFQSNVNYDGFLVKRK